MSIPYLPLYVSDYEADTAHLSMVEDGAYLRMLRLCWRTPGCSVPEDHAWIARRLRVSTEEFSTVVLPIIEEFFECKKGRVFSPRLQAEHARINSTSKKRSSAGKKGGRPAKPPETPDIDESPAKANGKQLEPELDSKKTISKKSGLPDGFPDLEAKTAASKYWSSRKRGYLSARLNTIADGFRAHHESKSTMAMSWPATWRTWYTNAVGFEEKNGVPERGDGKSGDRGVAEYRDEREAKVQYRMIDQWVKTGKWQSRSYSPPDDPKTRLRPEVLAEFGLGQSQMKIGATK